MDARPFRRPVVSPAMDLVELEQRARTLLAPTAYDYIAGGADDERTLADNAAAWGRVRLRPRVLQDVALVDASTTVLGTPVSLPVLVAPMAYHRLVHDEGEEATAAGTAAAGTVLVASTLATTSLEHVAAAAPGSPQWFQLYVHRDRGFTAELVARAGEAGYRALVLTVDLPVLGYRPRDERNRFTLPEGMVMANVGRSTEATDGSAIALYAAGELDPSLTPADVGWLRGLTTLPVLVKGVLRADDARTCVDEGAAGIVVSNHGGRQLDRAVTPLDVLPQVVEAVGGRAEVLLDTGITDGADIVAAVANGATACMVGRAYLYGLMAGGERGVDRALEIFRDQIVRTLQLLGVAELSQLRPAHAVLGGFGGHHGRQTP